MTTSSGFFAGIFFAAARHSQSATDWAIFAVAISIAVSGIGGLAMIYAPCTKIRVREILARRDSEAANERQ